LFGPPPTPDAHDDLLRGINGCDSDQCNEAYPYSGRDLLRDAATAAKRSPQAVGDSPSEYDEVYGTFSTPARFP
jgi:hypothetical protein